MENFELNESKSITYQNFWDAAKAVLRGYFIALNAYISEEERFQTNDLCLYLKKPKEQIKLSTNKEIIQIQWEINKKENRKAIKKHQTHKKQVLWKDQ